MHMVSPEHSRTCRGHIMVRVMVMGANMRGCALGNHTKALPAVTYSAVIYPPPVPCWTRYSLESGLSSPIEFVIPKFYETVAGGAGAGAGPCWEGHSSGVHQHTHCCTHIRSGGAGKNGGGDDVVHEIEPLSPFVISILSECRTLHPYGLAGEDEGACALALSLGYGVGPHQT
eukprot:scaffold289772_cov74-Attheya_sp.AAC.2